MSEPDETGTDWSFLNDGDVTSEPKGGKPAASRTGSGQRRGRRTAQSKLDDLQERLSGQMFMAGSMIGMAMPVTGYYTCQESHAFTKAVVQLASHRKEWVEALENLAALQPGLIVGRTAIGLGVAMAVDRGRADPEKPFIKFLGVYSAWLAVNGESDESEEGSGYRPPPGSYTPIT